MAANRAISSLYIDKSQSPDGGICAVYVRVSYKGKRKFYSIPKKIELSSGPIDGLTVADFKAVFGLKLEDSDKKGKRSKLKAADLKRIATFLNIYKSRAVTIIDKLDTRFSWPEFEKEYLGSQRAKIFLKDAFDDYAAQLEKETRIGTAVSHKCARSCFEKFKKGAEFTDVTVDWLKKYETWMKDQGNSQTTIGIYARNLRTIMKRYAGIPSEAYPFGTQHQGKYEIPTSANVKKALSTSQIKAIRDYKVIPGTAAAKARDFWLLIYYCNGINLKDIALLTPANIEGETLTFIRAKTIRTKKQQTSLTVKLNDSAQSLINRWRNKPGNTYLFPILSDGLTPSQQYERLHDFRAFVNENMKEIGNELGISNLTSYVGRHSFATTLVHKGFEIAYVSEALGHASVSTTQRYLASFGNEKRHAAANALDDL